MRNSTTWACGRIQLDCGGRPLLMAVVNMTPDSFSDGGRFADLDAAVTGCLQMLADGADILDIGGESTRPGAEPVAAAMEIERTVPLIAALRARTAAPISIDTMKAAVAEAALDAGADIINDVTGFTSDPDMAHLAAARGCGCVAMHMRGTPQTMQTMTDYQDVVAEVNSALGSLLAGLLAAGVAFENIVLDPGIGFGKTAAQNLELLRRLRELDVHGRPILLGTSRKSFIGRVLGKTDPRDRLWGTAASVALGVAAGATILRVHDVGPMRQCADLAWAVQRAEVFA